MRHLLRMLGRFSVYHEPWGSEAPEHGAGAPRAVEGGPKWESEGPSASRIAFLEATHSSLSPLFGRFHGFNWLRRSGLASQTEALALEVVDLPVMEKPIHEGRGQGRVMEHAAPFGAGSCWR